jgi:phage terminase large subunit
LHIFREFYKRKQLQQIVVSQTVEWSKEFGNPLIACDEAASGLIADLQSKGLRVQGAKGRTPESSGTHVIMDGVKAVQDRLKVQPDGKPRLTVDPNCVETIGEFESYAFAKTTANSADLLKDAPQKEFDHAMDAIRYLVALRMSTAGFSAVAGFMTGDVGGTEESAFEPEYIDFDTL